MKTIRDEEKNREILQFYKDKNEPVHIKINADWNAAVKPFRNGKTVNINENNIEFDEEVLGTIIIFFSEIKTVSKREARR